MADNNDKDDEMKSEVLASQLELEDIESDLLHVEKEINHLLSKQNALLTRKEKLQKTINRLQHDLKTKDIQWNTDQHPWSSEISMLLQQRFCLDCLRPLQKETMNVTLSNLDCILIMPTGGGKSLCFQLPALISKGFTLVVSPLISLMEDQLIALKDRDIEATMLSASISPKEVTAIQNQLIEKNCALKIIYVTPEKLAKSKRFMAKLEKAYAMGNLSRIVIDEVHCASHWGHDFRPDYKILGILKRQFPTVPLLGLTATASEKVLDDVKDILNLNESCIVFRASFNRPNLYYEVCKTTLGNKALIQEIAQRIKSQFHGESGIVYCFSRKDSEEVSAGLVQQGIKAHCYHGDINSDVKSNIHRSWTKGKLQVIVATIAFGMGIDKPNVRFVIHYSISKSMENYYQESGRAGRDGDKAWCILYFRFQDIFRQSAMVFTEKTGLENLYGMLRYAIDRTSCRRTLIGKHFAEHWLSSKCQQMCDSCNNNTQLIDQDLRNEAETLVSILRNAKSQEERLTPLKLIELWNGKGRSTLRPSAVTNHSREVCEIIVTKLLVEGVLTEDYHFTPYSTITYIVPGRRWNLLKNAQISVKIKTLSSEKKKCGKRKLVDEGQNDSDDDIVTIPKETKKKKTIYIDSSDSDVE